jgi:short-subunit dehydrogenase involved in D-alanine esterification of teichoic acids
MVCLRQQLKGKVNIIEINPPKVETELDAAHKEAGSKVQAMPLEEYTEKTFEILDNADAKDLKEVAVGFAENGAKAWRGAYGPILKGMNLGG